MNQQYDIVILGGTPGGIACGITAARLGRSVAIIEPLQHIGGMTTSGLGKSDVEQKEYIGGLFREFTDRVWKVYQTIYPKDSMDLKLCREGYYFTPKLAEVVLEEMIAETGKIKLLKHHRLIKVKVKNQQVDKILVENIESQDQFLLSGKVFIDATYEGDLYAGAGAEYRLGRESRHEYGEPHAGKIYFDYQKGVILPGSTGEGDEGLPAYTYRLCLTKDPNNSYVLNQPPANYDRNLYTPYFDDLKNGLLSAPAVLHDGWGYYPEHFDTMVRALSVTDLPGNKVDANINPRPLAFPFPEENKGYVEGDYFQRLEIARRHREIALGLLWFLQNDEEILPEHRAMAQQYHWPLDEFSDNEHFPYQLYVREARRLVGEYTLTEHDVAITEEVPHFYAHSDTIAMGEFPVDSFPVHKKQPGDTVVLEGYLGMLAHLTRPYEIPYRVMIPQKIEGLIVPVALSASHIAFCSIRMEPTWMSLGQAAGVAAHVSIQNHETPRTVDVKAVQEILIHQGQILSDPIKTE
ncbi:FAD-dependent oxidoreductase [Membranihabitans maritimus]|uniref:FAD-dependent oxidoreductase n=1 Tax=Membranihabitans maritimus TaxID=2904244 RepID=UPI001F38168A|nr:FAD-dependent oxidoreductase [Membranihabitans maritimus]